tara:strand:- start:2652 stop:3242 length:591 start_codon:yes stop_codon:yes gene_type:complete
MLTKKQQLLKRFFDVIMSLLLLPFLLLPLIFLIIIATLSTKQSGIFIQQRIGKEGKPFSFYKIRSLKGSNHRDINEIAMHQTNFGKWLRASKLDELPQLFNVINGTMSWVGPRPDVPGYADQLKREDQIILSVKPGVTGPATIKYKNEDLLLLQQKEPLIYNDTVIWPDKVTINKEYVQHWSLINDIGYLWKSVFA